MTRKRKKVGVRQASADRPKYLVLVSGKPANDNGAKR